MKPRNTLLALVLLAGLGGVLYYLNRHPSAAPSTDNSPERKKIFSFQPDQVKSFSINALDQPEVTVSRAGSGPQWQIGAPAGVKADSSSVQSFVDGLPKLEFVPVEAQTPAALAEYGLDQPQKTFQFQLNQGEPVTLHIGKENPGGYAKYGTISSTPGLFLLDDNDDKDLLEKNLFALRDKRILPVAVDQAKQVELHFDLKNADPAELEKARKLGLSVKPPKIAISKEANGNWQLTDPDVRTDFGDSNYFVTTVNGGVMTSVEADDPKSLASYGLDHPAIKLDVKMPDGSTHTLLVGKKKEAEKKAEAAAKPSTEPAAGYYAKNSDSSAVFLINQSVFDQLNQDLDNYRNRFLFDFDPANARRLEIQGPTGELRLDKKGDDWFKGDGKTKMDGAKVDAFLNAVHGLRISHYTEDRPGHLAEFALDKPWMKVKVTYGEANKEETILFGLKNKKFYAARQDAPSVYELSPTEPDALQPKLKDIS